LGLPSNEEPQNFLEKDRAFSAHERRVLISASPRTIIALRQLSNPSRKGEQKRSPKTF